MGMVLDSDPIGDRLLQIIDVVLGERPLIRRRTRHQKAMSDIETLIRRAARAAEFGVPEVEIAGIFAAEGVPADVAFLAVMAGRIAAQEPPVYEGDFEGL